MTTRDWEIITNYIESVGTTNKTFTFPKTQSLIKVTNKGKVNLTYTIGSKTGTLTPGQSISVSEKLTSFTLASTSGTQPFEVWSTEDGTEKQENAALDLNSINASLAERTQLKGTTQSIVFNANGTIQKVQHKDYNNVVLREDVFTYADNLITEVRSLSSGGSITFKYHLDTLETEVI